MKKNDFVCDCNIIHESDVQDVLKSMPKEMIFNDMTNFFKLIGDRTRVKILYILDRKEMCVCDIANVMSMTKSSISHQLSLLRKNKIVKCEKKGKEVFYSLDDSHVNEVFEIALNHINHR